MMSGRVSLNDLLSDQGDVVCAVAWEHLKRKQFIPPTKKKKKSRKSSLKLSKRLPPLRNKKKGRLVK